MQLPGTYLNTLDNNALSVGMIQFFSGASPEDLFHIDVYALADALPLDRKTVLNAFLSGVEQGVFDLAWEFHCPMCGGVARESIRLQDASSEDHCTICRLDFRNQLDENIEVFFSINAAHQPIPDSVMEDYKSNMMHDITANKQWDWKKPTTIRGIDCINNPLFRDLFESDTLPLDQSLEIKYATLLFTDIKGSTAMYEALGDSRAYLLVREHFNILFTEIESANGVPVKTIGDAVMGVFSSDHDALRAALAAQQALRRFYATRTEAERIEVKIGLHAGPAIVVTLNGRLDYFGTTVNTAARIQGEAGPGEILISRRIFDKPDNKKLIKTCTDRVTRRKTSLKGLSGEHYLYGIRCTTAKTGS